MAEGYYGPIICLGEALVDIVCERELDSPADADAFRPHPGGALANVAVAAAREGGSAALVGGVGADPWGSWIRSSLERENVDLRWLARVEGIGTPVVFITFDRSREPRFQVYGEGIGATIEAAAGFLAEAIDEGEALIYGSNTLVGEPERTVTDRALEIARDRAVPILFDPNLRINRWPDERTAVEQCRRRCEGAMIVRANHQEASAITGTSDPIDAAEAFCELGAVLGVVTLGPGGAVMRGASSGEEPSPEVEVVTPLGAGDAFMGALAAGLARLDWDSSRAAEALPAAVAAAARACTGWGAQA